MLLIYSPRCLDYSAKGHPETPDRTCLFCEQIGVERYGGVVDLHVVTDGSSEIRGPLCGNCHTLLMNERIDTGGWRLKPA